MKTINIYKAQPVITLHTCPSLRAPTCGNPTSANECFACRPESTTIVIDRAIPGLPDHPTPPFQNVQDVQDEARHIYRKEATELTDALMAALPGGTVDALLVELMERKVSLFRVPFAEPPKAEAPTKAWLEDKFPLFTTPIENPLRNIDLGPLGKITIEPRKVAKSPLLGAAYDKQHRLISRGDGTFYSDPQCECRDCTLEAHEAQGTWDREKVGGAVLAFDRQDITFHATRIRRVAKLLGLENAVPAEDDCLMGCIGTVMGTFARKIEEAQQEANTWKLRARSAEKLGALASAYRSRPKGFLREVRGLAKPLRRGVIAEMETQLATERSSKEGLLIVVTEFLESRRHLIGDEAVDWLLAYMKKSS